MNAEDVLREFEEAGALLRGHFILSSGLRSDTYLNKSIVSMYPDRTERLCRALAAQIRARFGEDIAAVIAPAMGAIIYGYETARHLGRPFMFTERVDGQFELRRGFSVSKGAKIVVVEDIVSTGLSARECIAAVQRHGGDVVGLACLIDRSGGNADVGVPMLALAQVNIAAYPPDALPAHLAAIPAVKPGSRGIRQ
ncbi:MAG: orotate phosphoribosyltransferase [Myxococcota bacterium]